MLQNDTIKNVALFIASKGNDGYFWVPFDKLESVLLEYEINIPNRFNNILVEQFSFEGEIDYYHEIFALLSESNSLPHIYVHNLDLLCSAIVNEHGELE